MNVTDVTEQVKEIGMGALGLRMGLEYLSAQIDDRGFATVTASMPVEGNTQPYGLLHGGANAVLAESVGSVASGITAHTLFGDGHIVVGIDLNCTHHKSARSGKVIGVAKIISAGKTVITSHIEIKDEEDRLICTARLTCVVRSMS
jgi:1,4-dihydroxy-2-naphthoyl-CoA hydrolase